MGEDLYNLLGVSRTASASDIKQAYRKLASKLHPDKNPGNASAEARFKRVNTAFQVLGDKKRRALYDEFGDAALSESFDEERARMARQWGGQAGGSSWGRGDSGVHGFSIEDLFGRAEGGGGEVGQGVGQGVGDFFADFFGGGGKRRGTRSSQGADLEQSLSIDFVSAVRGTTVKLVAPGDTEPVHVRIPPGVQDGSKMRVKGKGAPSPVGGPSGDLHLEIHVEPHPHFRMEGNDLHVNLPITIAEAYQGAKVQVPTPHGLVTMKVVPGTQSGMSARLRGKGIARQGRSPGDLYVHFQVHVPTSQDSQVQDAIDALSSYDQDVRSSLHF